MYIFLVIMYSSIYVGGKDLPKFSKITKLRYFYNDQGKPNCSCLILSIIIPNYELYKTIFYIPACLPALFSIVDIYKVLLTGSTSTSSNLAHCHCTRRKWCHYHHRDGHWSVLSQPALHVFVCPFEPNSK